MCNVFLNSTSININEDWKMITIWIGGNDLCDYCNDKVKRIEIQWGKLFILRLVLKIMPRGVAAQGIR